MLLVSRLGNFSELGIERLLKKGSKIMGMRIAMTAGLVSAIALGSLTTMARGATVFSDNFENGIGPNWSAASAANFTTGTDPVGVLPTQVVFPNAGGSREYLVTNDLDYITTDFTASVVLSNNCGGCGDILVFFGLGDGSKSDNEEPVGVFMRAHTDGVAGNRVDTAYNTGPGIGNPLIQQAFAPNPPLGAHKAIMQKSGNMLTFGYDVGNDGVGAFEIDGQRVDFKADPIDLTLAPANILNDTNSAIFIGTGNRPVTHALDNFTMQGVIPEPSTLVFATLGQLGLLGFARRRRK